MRGARSLFCLFFFTAGPLAADPADDAFARGAYLEAREIWQTEAEEGHPDARFNLGVLHDLGLGVERDSDRAFEHYRSAADAGHAEAQFNVAVMIDAGTVGAPDPDAAAVWYGRAAANGVPRAAYNLGLLYLGGTGVARNANLARYWLGQAGEAVPAARDALDRIEPEEPTVDLAEPIAQGGARVELPDGAARAELVWTADPDSSDAPFVVQLAEMPGNGALGSVSTSVETPGSAVAIPLDDPGGRYAWRVLRIASDRENYAASTWSALDPAGPDASVPRGLVRFEVGPDDPAARRLAGAMAEALAANDLVVRIEEGRDAVAATSVRYAFETDAPLARAVAEVIPGLEAGSAEPGSTRMPVPGEVIVALSGGLEAGSAPRQDPANQTSIPTSVGAGE